MLSRRAFLATSTTSVAAGAALPGCVAPRSIVAAPAVAPRLAGHSSPHVELEEQTLAMLAGRLDRGELSATTLLERYLARIDALDRNGPELRSVIELNPDAAALAAQLDAERKAGKRRGPLHGLPILLKDNIDTGDRMLTTAGSLALTGAPAPADAFLVTRLRAAGALIFGKTNLSEWANIRSLRSTSGWSARGGLGKNPYALDRNCSGSSSGSAAAVAANLCAAAVGSETDGSILSPSSICGLVGVKPTLGAISRRGMIPISHSQDTAGPMARTVEDAALLLAAMVGADPADPVTAAQPADLAAQLLRGFTREALRGQRLGVVRKWPMSDAVLGSFATAVDQLRELGAEIIELELPPMADLWDHELVVLLAELKANLAVYLATRNLPVKSLADVIAFNQREAGKELTWFGQDAFVKAEASPALTDPAYLEARARCLRQARDESLDALLGKHQLAALVFPSGGPAWLTDPLNGDAYTGGTSTLAAVAGYPSVTVPSAELRGLPLGISFIGRPWSEATILGFAFAFEQASKARRTPGFLASLPLP